MYKKIAFPALPIILIALITACVELVQAVDPRLLLMLNETLNDSHYNLDNQSQNTTTLGPHKAKDIQDDIKSPQAIVFMVAMSLGTSITLLLARRFYCDR